MDRLKGFVAVADLLSFTRAAEQLHTAQSPLSRRIQGLEADLGVRLFDRTTRDVRLTPAGATFYRQITPLLEGYDSAIAATRHAAIGGAGSLSVGFSEIWHSTIPLIIGAFTSNYPSALVRIHTGLLTTNHLEMLHSRRVDVGVIGIPDGFKPGGLVVLDLEPYIFSYVVVAAGNPLSVHEEVDAADLADQHFIGYPSTTMPIAHSATVAIGRAGGFEPNIRLIADGLQVHLALVAAGLGISIMSASSIIPASEGVRYLRLRTPQPTWPFALAYSEDNRNPLIPAYVQTVLDTL